MTRRRRESDDCESAFDAATLDRLSACSVDEQVDLLSTLGNDTRYRVLLFLTEAETAVCGCELEPHLDVGQSSISQSLNRLRKAGLVTRTKEGRWRYYEATETAERLVDLVEDIAAETPIVAD
ncbi:metalloregulator ArsR/SmtB family transcription factor [Natronomonas gomsonensis]|uniref:ArsR/SmtB family transcription factor n=1 Tax=Natronomonas gomsonensis TaxID=1046043 RepID=UPI00227D39C0|nr:metalloregulator ArsR/SmtB family transcription factor [Natronomonas gomsonensis]MCY4732972.1 metalloregulator ArsR/SmtB family transcription factor [Natronomonas gomsonensis]